MYLKIQSPTPITVYFFFKYSKFVSHTQFCRSIIKTNLLFPNEHAIEMESQRSVLTTCVIQSTVCNTRDSSHSVTKPVDEMKTY